MKKKKLKIAIFDMTDCEGCELEFINLREKLARLADSADFANWRLASDNHNPGPFDVTFIEGTPITEEDIAEDTTTYYSGSFETRLTVLEKDFAELKEAFDKLMKELNG